MQVCNTSEVCESGTHTGDPCAAPTDPLHHTCTELLPVPAAFFGFKQAQLYRSWSLVLLENLC